MLFAVVHASLDFPDSIEPKAWNPILHVLFLYQQIVSALYKDAFQLLIHKQASVNSSNQLLPCWLLVSCSPVSSRHNPYCVWQAKGDYF